MKLAEKIIELKDGRKIRVSEASFDMGIAQGRMQEEARADRARLNGSGDPVQLFFLESYYAALRSCSLGEDIPSLGEALEMDPEDLDRWHLSLIEVNPLDYIPVDRLAEGRIEFRDGSSFRIRSGYLPSVQLRRARLEAEALAREEDKEEPKDIFAVYLYPLLASCSHGEGDLPGAEELRKSWPQSEIYRWRDAVKEVNPQWFGEAGEPAPEPEAIQKKKGKSRVK